MATFQEPASIQLWKASSLVQKTPINKALVVASNVQNATFDGKKIFFSLF